MAAIMRSFGGVLRGLGKAMDQTGLSMQGQHGYKERLAIHAQRLAIQNKVPNVHPQTFIAPNATLIGNVDLSLKSSVYYCSVLKGESNNIVVGESTTIEEHVTITANKKKVTLGSNVVIGSGSTLIDCTIHDGVYIGPGCVILEGSVIEKDAVLAPGTFVAPNTVISSGNVWSGNPAKLIRGVEKDEADQFLTAAKSYFLLSKIHAEECAKPLSQVEAEIEAYKGERALDPDFVTTLPEFKHIELLPQLEGFIYPIQLRTYFEVEKAVPIAPERIFYISENEDPKKVMEETLASQGIVAEEMGTDKKSYWYVG